jgi:glycosyltransferase involved in cell wall biosynthesis
MSPSDDFRRIAIYPQIRSAHIEREAAAGTKEIWFFRTHPDLAEPRGDGIRAHRPVRALLELLVRPPDVLEVPEPLWLRWLPFSIAAAFLVKARTRFSHCRSSVVTYALQNADIARQTSTLPRPARRPAKIAIRVALAFSAKLIDRAAFGTPGSEATYDASSGGKWPVRNRRVFLALPASCICPAGEVRRQWDVLFAAMLEPRKGVPQLLTAWPVVRAAVPDARLLIAGDGPLAAAVAAAAAEKDGGISYLGPLPRDALHALFRRAHCVVLFSQPHGRWREQIGLPILEGLAHGNVIVASDESGFAATLAHSGHTVIAHDAPADELATAIIGALDAPPETLDLPGEDQRLAADTWLHAAGDGP